MPRHRACTVRRRGPDRCELGDGTDAIFLVERAGSPVVQRVWLGRLDAGGGADLPDLVIPPGIAGNEALLKATAPGPSGLARSWEEQILLR